MFRILNDPDDITLALSLGGIVGFFAVYIPVVIIGA